MTAPRQPSLTDRRATISSGEFVWEGPEPSEAHTYLLPPVSSILRAVGATRVLDLGCGNGAFTAAIGAAGFAVSGCDSSASGIAIAQKAHPDIHFFSQDLCSPLEERHRGEYDAVISMEVIEHLPAPRVLMERALQALRRGGAFVLSTPFHGYWKNLALALTNQFDDHWHPLRDFGHVKFFSRRTLVQLFQEYPFSVRTFLTVGRIPAFARSMILVGTKR